MQLVRWWKVVVLERYSQFNGRASRAEYWWLFLANLVLFAILGLLSRASTVFDVLYALVALALVVPSIAVGVRRLHDTSKSDWWILIGLVPIVGFIVLLVLYAIQGDLGPNQYGPPPPGEPALA